LYKSKICGDNLESFYSFDGKKINYLKFCKTENSHALICLHGLGSYAQYYIPLGEYLNKHNISVYALEFRSFGTSDIEPKWRYSRLDDIVADLEIFYNMIKESSYTKISILGDSLGALIALKFSTKNKLLAIKLILSSSFHNPLSNLIIRFLRHLRCLPDVKIKVIGNIGIFTKNKEFVRFDRELNLGAKHVGLHVIVATLEIASELNDLILLSSELNEIMFLHGKTDHATRYKSIEKLLSKHKNVTYKLYENSSHFIINENPINDVYSDIAKFLRI